MAGTATIAWIAGPITNWNPSDRSPNVTLLGSNLTTSFAATFSGVRSIATLSGTDKKRFQVKVNAIGGTNSSAMGVANSTLSLTAPLEFGNNVNGWGIVFDNANILKCYNGVYTGVAGGVAVNDIIDVLIDMGTSSIYVYLNNVLLSGGALFTSLTGTLYAYIGSWNDAVGNFTTNFGGSPFTYTYAGYTGF